MARNASAPRARLVRLVLCLSLLAQPMLAGLSNASAGNSASKVAPPVGKNVSARQEAEADDLPDLDEARRRPRHEPRAIPPIPSRRRRCPPHNKRCNDDIDGRALPASTPATPKKSAQADGGGAGFIASAAGLAFLTLLTAALDGGRPAVDVPLLDFYSGGSYSVSDSAPASPLSEPNYAAAAAPAPFIQAQPTPQPLVTNTSLGAMRSDAPGWTGFQMTTGSQPLTLTALGRLCSPGNSLLHELRVVRASDNVLLAATSVSMSGCAVNQFKYEDLPTPVTLSANTSYVVVSYEVGGDLFYDWTGQWLTTTSVAAVNGAIYTTNGGQTWSLATGNGNSYVPVDFKYQTSEQALGTGLTARYYDNLDFTAYKMTRVDPTIIFDWGPNPPSTSMDADQFSVRWSGMVAPRYSQTYTFYATTDDGVRLWVDGQLIIDKWVDQGPTTWSAQLPLDAGRRYDIRMEFYENFGGAQARLEWQSVSQAREVIPQSRLYPCWKSVADFVKEFFQAALARQPSAAELQDWSGRLAQAQGESQLIEQARALGVALFDLSPSSAYTARNRGDGDFVADLYRGFLQRDPDQSGWNFWLGEVQNHDRATVREAFAQSPEFREKVKRLWDTSAAAVRERGHGL